MKGILIEKKSRNSVILDQNGRFIKTRTIKSWNEGDEVNFTSGAAKAAKSMSVAAAIVLVFALSLFAVYAGNAYTVNLDVNPSIEIEVNAFNNVESIIALNDDAVTHIGELEGLVGMKFGPAVNAAIQLLVEQGYLEEDGTVVLSITGKNGKLKIVEKELSESLGVVEIETEDDEDEDLTTQDSEPKIKVYVGRVTEEIAEAAQDFNVPIGRMVLAAKAQEEGAEISYEMASMLSVQELQRIRNLSKTLNKATEMMAGVSDKGQKNGNGSMTQVEAMTDKILNETAKIEKNLSDLEAMITNGEADAEMIERHAVLTIQLESLLTKMEKMGVAADTEAEEIITGLAQYKGADSEEKARIREEIKEAKNADNDAKKEENRTRVEEKMDELKDKVNMLQGAKNKSDNENSQDNAGDNAGDDAGDNAGDDAGDNAGDDAGGNAGNNAGGNSGGSTGGKGN